MAATISVKQAATPLGRLPKVRPRLGWRGAAGLVFWPCERPDFGASWGLKFRQARTSYDSADKSFQYIRSKPCRDFPTQQT